MSEIFHSKVTSSIDGSIWSKIQLGFGFGDRGLRPGKLRQLSHPSDMGAVEEDKEDNDLKK